MAKRGVQTLPIESLSELRTGRHRRPCGGCKTLTCHSIHGSVSQDCSIKDCRVCGDLETVDEEISNVYDYFVKLVQKRSRIIEKPHHDPLIHHFPAEIFSLIFVFVKEALNRRVGKPSFNQLPPPSPPLRVGSVCKKWRDITLRTPQLWTDITVDLMKPVDAQLKMIDESARRSGALPLNVSISLPRDSNDREEAVLNEWDDVAKALRSLAIRWNTVAIQAPWSICYKLLDQLENPASITSFHALFFPSSNVVDAIKLRRPLRPKYFYSWDISGAQIPCEWDNLVHLQLGCISRGELIHIIHHAQKLRHLTTEDEQRHREDVHYPIPTTPVINQSIIHFKIRTAILNHLTLPSLQYLDCGIISPIGTFDYADSVIEFLTRSQVSPQTFIFEWGDSRMSLAPWLEKLPLITSLNVVCLSECDPILQALTTPSTQVVLPRLQILKINAHSIGSSSWSLFSRLFRSDIQLDTPGLKAMKDSVTLSRPLSKISLDFLNDVVIDKNTLLHLLAVRKSGVELSITAGEPMENVFHKMAKLYDVGPVR